MVYRGKGTLIYVMGPSGAGKDTLLRHACRHTRLKNVVFAQRHITRPLPAEAEAEDERHIPLSEREFDARRKNGFFALHWQSHGLRYGIAAAINEDLRQGRTVVVNGSREYLPEALLRYPALMPVLITASPDVLRARLQGRGRESGEALEERLQGAGLTVSTPCIRIDNSGPLEHALDALLTVLESAGFEHGDREASPTEAYGPFSTASHVSSASPASLDVPA